MEIAELCCNKDSTSGKQTLVINDIINNTIKREGYNNYEAKYKFNSINEQGFMGSTCEIDIKGMKDNREQETNLFLKMMNPINSSFILTEEVYAKELFIYRNLSKVYKDLQNEYNIPKEHRYKMVKSYPESSSTVIVLENMNKKGYTTHHRSQTVSLEFAALAVKELAKFHALSFAIKEKKPTYFEQNIKKLNHSLDFNENWVNFIHIFIDITIKYVNNDIKRKLEIFKTVFLEKFKMFMEDDKFKRCLCHGDFRPCNILKKEANGAVSDVILVDYQLAYYGCPAMDLIYLIFIALDQNMRRNIPYLKDIYYETLELFLTYFDIKVQDVFPRKEFEIMYTERLEYGLQTSLLLMPILMASDDNLTDLATMASTSQNTGKECQERMIGIINDIIEWGYL